MPEVARHRRRQFCALVFGTGRGGRRLTCEEYRRLVPQYNPVLTRKLLEPSILRSILLNCKRADSDPISYRLWKMYARGNVRDPATDDLFAQFGYLPRYEPIGSHWLEQHHRDIINSPHGIAPRRQDEHHANDGHHAKTSTMPMTGRRTS